MADSIMFDNDAYVILEPDREERLVTPAEMADKLREVVIEFTDDLPIDVRQIAGVEEKVKYLLDTSCELELRPGQYLQWYEVRLQK